MRGRKKTMLLTVIAVATLLVAVVGATFAYFSLTVDSTGNTTKGTVATDKIGTVTFEKGITDLTLGVSAQDMIDKGSDTTYYGIAEAYSEGTYKHSDSNSALTIASVKLEGAGEGDTYTCKNNTLTVTPSADSTMIAALASHEGWVKLDVGGTMVTPKSIDFSTETAGQAITVEVPDITLTSSSSTKSATAVLSLVNKTGVEQNDIAGKIIKLDIVFTPGTCEVSSGS